MIRLTSTLQTGIKSREDFPCCLSRLLEIRRCCSLVGSDCGQRYGLVCEPHERLIPCTNACYRAIQVVFPESQPQSSIGADFSNTTGPPTLDDTYVSMIFAYKCLLPVLSAQQVAIVCEDTFARRNLGR
jgi:hypothetical protein